MFKQGDSSANRQIEEKSDPAPQEVRQRGQRACGRRGQGWRDQTLGQELGPPDRSSCLVVLSLLPDYV